ncbi:hypothetical protein NCS56_01275900 [Fusarium sp. Ph1]|nr:hypothetical protein NCS56_01275900 [Fusarium sp. Ph1]
MEPDEPVSDPFATRSPMFHAGLEQYGREDSVKALPTTENNKSQTLNYGQCTLLRRERLHLGATSEQMLRDKILARERARSKKIAVSHSNWEDYIGTLLWTRPTFQFSV